MSAYANYFLVDGVDPSGMLPPSDTDPFDLFPPLPPSGPVTEPGIMDPKDYFEDLLKDLLKDEAKERIIDPFKEEIWDPWWDDHNPFNDHDDDPLGPPSEGPRRPGKKPWWDPFKPDRIKIRPKPDEIKIELEWIGDDTCPSDVYS